MVDAVKTGSKVTGKNNTKATNNVKKTNEEINVFDNKKPACDSHTLEKQQRAKKYYNEYIENGKLAYHPELSLLGAKIKDAYYTYTPDKNESFGNLKDKLNLPDGTFAEVLDGYPGNKDLYQVKYPVDIKADIIHKAIGAK